MGQETFVVCDHCGKKTPHQVEREGWCRVSVFTFDHNVAHSTNTVGDYCSIECAQQGVPKLLDADRAMRLRFAQRDNEGIEERDHEC